MSVWPAILLTLKLAVVSTAILLAMAMPLAWWLSTTRARVRPLIEAAVTLRR